MIPPLDAWTVARLLAGQPLNGELQEVSGSFGPLVIHLAGLPVEARQTALDGFLCGPGLDRTAIEKAVDDADPSEPPPEVEASKSFATLADIERMATDQRWVWDRWIARGVLNAVAAEPGTGKTRFALDLARRLWFGMPWPDGQANDLPEGTRTLWVQADRAFDEMLAASRAFGLPGEAVALGASPGDPKGSLDLDDPDTLVALADRIQAARPAIVVIDTVGMTTRRDLCRTDDAREFFGPLMDLAASSGVAFLGLTHLSKDKEALGRRIVEKARVVIKMTRPDPEGQPTRRKLWVDKSAAMSPPALGVTMTDGGNDYDFKPPVEPVPGKVGAPPEKREKAIAFIREALMRDNDLIGKELEAEWEKAGGNSRTFWRAVQDMISAGDLTTDGGTGTGKRKVFHLNHLDAGPDGPA
jgi:hypothetical protein